MSTLSSSFFSVFSTYLGFITLSKTPLKGELPEKACNLRENKTCELLYNEYNFFRLHAAFVRFVIYCAAYGTEKAITLVLFPT